MFEFVPNYLEGSYFWKSLWPNLLLPICLSTAASYLITRRRRYRPLFGTYVSAILAFSILGIVIGNITGLSRNPAVSATVPAILTLVGGVLAFVIGSQGVIRQRLVSTGLVCLSVCLLVGVMWGSRARVIFEYQSKAYEASAAAREAQKTSQAFLENVAYEAALRRMMNEVKFVQLKSGLELKHNLKLMTVYPELKLMTAVQEKK